MLIPVAAAAGQEQVLVEWVDLELLLLIINQTLRYLH